MLSRCAALLVLCLPIAAQAGISPYTLATLPGTRSVGMGDAFRAVGTSNDAIVDDPAALAMAQHYEIDGFFGYAFASPATYWNASLVDSSTTPLAVGVDYTHIDSGASPDRFGGSNLRLALAYPLSEQFFIGVSGNWLDMNPTGGNPPVSPEGNALHANSITGDAAIIFKPIDILSIAAVGYNLVPVNNPYLAPLEGALAVAVGSDTTFRAAADLVANFSAPSTAFDFHLGGEYLIAQLVAVRAGYEYDGLFRQSFSSVGAGLVMESFAFDVSFRQQIPQWNDNALILGFKLFLPT
ncbi:MAG: PorV/PorQ family protein [Myxococcales bacterium]